MGRFLDTTNRDIAILRQTLYLAHFRGYFPSRRMNGNVRNLYGFVENSWVFLDKILVPENFSDEPTRTSARITIETDKYLRETFNEETKAIEEVDKAVDRAIPFSTGTSSQNPEDWIKLYDLTAPIYERLLRLGVEEQALISP